MLEQLVSHARIHHGFDLAMQLGWRDKQYDFGVAAGGYNLTDAPLSPNAQGVRRNATTADTYLFGSGTKPFTAVGVLRLIDQGKIGARDRVSKHINPFLLHNNGTTLEKLFGAAISNATVLDLIEMSAGISDFEIEVDHSIPFDNEILKNGNKVWTPYDYILYAANAPNQTGPGGHILCEPRACRSYSSTSFQVAGLLLASVLNPEGDWFDLDMSKAILPQSLRYPSLRFLADSGRISDHLTIPGQSVGGSWEKTVIYDQNPSILGWSCGNLVGTTLDVARFFYDLFDPGTDSKLVSEASSDEMKQVKMLTTGWAAGHLNYGAGIMALSPDRNKAHAWPKGPSDWGFTFGHGGDTYGFQTFQGYTPTLHAAWSVGINNDANRNYAGYAQCFMLQIAMKHMAHVDWDFKCSLPDKYVESVYV